MKTLVSVTIDTVIMEEARRKRINISEACEMGIAKQLNMAVPGRPAKQTIEDKAADALEAIPELKAMFLDALDKDIIFAKGWRTRIMNGTGLELTNAQVMGLYHRLKPPE
jgi:post-segregation antitoxin (ccd killing protein)